jgi:hypothetical protein
MTTTSSAEELYAALRKPFEAVDLEWRAMFTKDGDQGPLILVAPYVNRPALINRLNQVCGIDGWQSDARVSGGRVYVGVGVRVASPMMMHGVDIIPGGGRPEWVWRWDGTGMLKAEGDHFSESSAGKGDFSNAFKRACEHFGIALYLREIRPMRAVIDRGGRYKSKVGQKVYRWEPPGLDGTPAYPGEIPGWDAEEGGERGSSATDAGDAEPEPGPKAAPPERLEGEPAEAEIQRCKDRVRSFMNTHRLRVYHLDAMVLTHPTLKLRYSSGSAELGRIGTVEDWQILDSLAGKNALRWDAAEKALAEEYPADPDRLAELDQLLDRVKVTGEERVVIAGAMTIGWNDAIEYWLTELGKR